MKKKSDINEKTKVLLIIPAYNEEKNIEKTIEMIENCKDKYDYIIVNDGSHDKTKEICKKNNYPHINLISNLGIGGAVQTGYKYALENNYDVAIQFDGDGQHDINYVKKLLEYINEGYDIVIGSRFLDKNTSEFKSTISRQFGIKIISAFIYTLTKKKITDPTSGFRAINRKLINLFANSYPTEFPEPISFVTLIKRGYIFKEVAVKMYERKAGKSSIHTWKSVYYMINVCFSMIIINLRRYK